MIYLSTCVNPLLFAMKYNLLRSVCNYRPGKETRSGGQFTLFHACDRTPLLGKLTCEIHKELMEPMEPTEDEEMYIGPMTRAKAKTYGLEVELISSNEGCRKPEKVTVQSSRTVTSGMLYVLRPCGVALTHTEMITAGCIIVCNNCIKY